MPKASRRAVVAVDRCMVCGVAGGGGGGAAAGVQECAVGFSLQDRKELQSRIWAGWTAGVR